MPSPHEPVLLHLHARLHWLSPSGRDLIKLALLHSSEHLAPDALALRLGLRNRFQLHHLLRREALPPFRELMAWMHLLTWAYEAAAEGESLCRLALHTGEDPSYRYRLTKRLMGKTRSQVRDGGLLRVVDALIERAEVLADGRNRRWPSPSGTSEPEACADQAC
jgi:hypothetical protein